MDARPTVDSAEDEKYAVRTAIDRAEERFDHVSDFVNSKLKGVS